MDVSNMRCAYGGGCVRYPKYNSQGAQTGVVCRQHAEDSMVDVTSKRCAYLKGCTRQPTFGHEGTRKEIYCKSHAEESMVAVVHKRCVHSEGCTSRPTWGYWADGKSTVCAKHKGDLTGGLSINFNQRCKEAGEEGCGRTVKWGMGGEQPTHCHHHGAARAGEGFVRIPSGRGTSRPWQPASGAASGRRHATKGAGSGSRSGGGVESARNPEPPQLVGNVPEDGRSDGVWDYVFGERE